MDTDQNSYSIHDFILTYSSLPMHYVLHNRHTKYIGGLYSDFRRNFNGRKEVGSIWTRNDTIVSIRSTMQRAVETLAFYPSLIIGLHERFQETLCTLEVVYGHVHSFTWRRDIHAHNFESAYNITKENRILNRYRSGDHADVFESWRKRNEADMELYNHTIRLFDIQFKEALSMLRELNASGKYVFAPHCETFILSNRVDEP